MKKYTKPTNLKTLNHEMFALINVEPSQVMPVIDFHYKSWFPEYIKAINQLTGRKLLVFSNSVDDLRATIRRLMLISDSIVFNINTYSQEPRICLFALPDKKIPANALAVQGVIDSSNPSRISRITSLPEVAEQILQMEEGKLRLESPDSLFGFEWNRPDSSWQRTDFILTSSRKKIKRGLTIVGIAGTCYEYDSQTYNWILGEARPLLLDGYLAFAPFIRSSPGLESLEERLQKARLSSTRLATEDDRPILHNGTIHPLALLNVPYLENVPLELLAKALRDESESLRAFRRIVDRALEDVSKLQELSEIEKEITRLKRELLEDELDRVGKLCQRLSRMKSFAAVSAVVTTAAMTAVGAMNVGLPTLILTGSAGVTTTLKELVEIYEQQKEIKNSPMHLFWKLGHLKKS